MMILNLDMKLLRISGGIVIFSVCEVIGVFCWYLATVLLLILRVISVPEMLNRI
jgi:hypothetical protein